MNKDTYRKLELLTCCTFVVGSYNKRFVYHLCALPQEANLTDKQAANIDRLYWRYRKQIAPRWHEGDPELVNPEGGDAA